MNSRALAISEELAQQPGFSPYEMLYGDAIGLRFDKKAHAYYAKYFVVKLDGRERYADLNTERRVPSVTQIIGCLDKPALIYWAANCCVDVFRAKVQPGVAYDEIQLSQIGESIRREFRSVSKKALDIGTLVHEWIERGCDETNVPVHAGARKCCQDALAWVRGVNFTPSHSERRLYSRRHRYAGTLDAMSTARVNGRPAIVDFKTSKAIYPEMRFQLAAYKCAIEEMTGEKGFDRWIVRLPKEEGDTIEPVLLPRKEYRADLKAFLGLRDAYLRLQQINGKAA